MILIVGGRGQGKLSFALSLMNLEYREDRIADGEKDAAEMAFARPVIRNFHLYIRRCMEDGMSAEAFTERILRENPDAAVVTDEIGCGVVPMEAFQREYRDETGRQCQRLARASREVYRVICGIGMQLK